MMGTTYESLLFANLDSLVSRIVLSNKGCLSFAVCNTCFRMTYWDIENSFFFLCASISHRCKSHCIMGNVPACYMKCRIIVVQMFKLMLLHTRATDNFEVDLYFNSLKCFDQLQSLFDMYPWSMIHFMYYNQLLM